MESTESVALERARNNARSQALRVRDFMQFAGVYLAIGMFFFLINVFAGVGNLWFFWPMLPMTIPLVILAWRAFALPRFDDHWVEERVEQSMDRAHASPPPPVPSTELDAIMDEAATLIDNMRRHARQIPGPAVRAQALDLCAAADRVLSAIGENPSEVALARDFMRRYLTPASTILADYSRLAGRNVASARPTLERVEAHDLPLLQSKLNEVHDRLHRGSLIDLQVAREMLSLDVSDWGDDTIGPGVGPDRDVTLGRPAPS